MHNWDKKHRNHCGVCLSHASNQLCQSWHFHPCVWTLMMIRCTVHSCCSIRLQLSAGACTYNGNTNYVRHCQSSSSTAQLSAAVVRGSMNWLEAWPSWSLPARRRLPPREKLVLWVSIATGTLTLIHTADYTCVTYITYSRQQYNSNIPFLQL